MTSVVAGGLFNAVDFAGAGYVFHKLDKKGYEDEMKRHDLAMEQLKAASDKWYEKTVEKKHKVALLHQQLVDANKDLDATNDALHKLHTAMDEDIGPEPTINDYYEPSDEMKTYTDIVVGVTGSVAGVLATKLLF